VKTTKEKSTFAIINNDYNKKVLINQNDKKLLKDSLIFDQMALNLFIPLAENTNGKLYFAVDATKLTSTIISVVKNHAIDSTDIVLLIDKTGSMQDDIEEVKKNTTTIINEINKLQNIKTCIATYGDKNIDGRFWFKTTILTDNNTMLNNTINNINITGGGDIPESVYDGIYAVLNKIKWRSNSKRMILVIGDAPPLEGKLTNYTQSQVIKKCKEMSVQINLYPIIVGLGFADTTTTK